jgi:predicted GNAT family acetyltransferase
MSVKDVSPSRIPIAIAQESGELLRHCFKNWLPDIAHRQPFIALAEGNNAVSLCASVRISEAVHCAGVETHIDHRRRGYALDVVAGWAHSVRSQGATPFYSTSWDNIASQHVASRLGFVLAAVDFHVT